MSSYTKINYNLRMAKTVERKMFLETFRRLSAFGKVEKYQYIGFGSTYFNDFILYHKSLGLHDMISIEKEKTDEGRFNFNKPYSCINIKFGTSTEVLPTLPWKKKAIVWLDYDYDLKDSVLEDINSFVSSALSGSMLILTVKAHPFQVNTNNEAERNDARMKNLKEKISEDKIPRHILGKDLNMNKLNTVYREIIINELDSAISKRNGILAAPDKLEAKQIFNILYQDGAKMLTLGFVLFSKKDELKMKQAEFNSLAYYSDTEQAFEISIPNLTLKELKFLDALLPNNVNITTGLFKKRKKNIPLLPYPDIIDYCKIYRYFPTFAEALV